MEMCACQNRITFKWTVLIRPKLLHSAVPQCSSSFNPYLESAKFCGTSHCQRKKSMSSMNYTFSPQLRWNAYNYRIWHVIVTGKVRALFHSTLHIPVFAYILLIKRMYTHKKVQNVIFQSIQCWWCWWQLHFYSSLSCPFLRRWNVAIDVDMESAKAFSLSVLINHSKNSHYFIPIRQLPE